MPRFIKAICIDWSDEQTCKHKHVPHKKFTRMYAGNRNVTGIFNELYSHVEHLDGLPDSKIIVDFKVYDLRAGDKTCDTLDYHIDWSNNPKIPTETHLIYSNIDGTVFVLPDGSTHKAGNGEIWMYGRELHRGVRVERNCKRVLMRVSHVYNRNKTYSEVK